MKKESQDLENRLSFIRVRDAGQWRGREYLHYIEEIGDTARLGEQLNLCLIFDYIQPTPNEFRILDLCCGPGIAGTTIDKILQNKGYIVSNVTFVDANDDRLPEIPSDERYTVIKDDVLKFLGGNAQKEDDLKFDIIVLRNGLYYFNFKEKDRLFRYMRRSFRKERGSFVLISYAFLPEEITFLTELHKFIFSYRFSADDSTKAGRGVYDDTLFLADLAQLHGFNSPAVLDIGEVTLRTDLFAQKYELNAAQIKRLETFLEMQDKCKKKNFNIRSQANNISFDINAFSLEFFMRVGGEQSTFVHLR